MGIHVGPLYQKASVLSRHGFHGRTLQIVADVIERRVGIVGLKFVNDFVYQFRAVQLVGREVVFAPQSRDAVEFFIFILLAFG